MTFRTIGSVDRLDAFAGTLTPVISECKLHLTETGIRAIAVDPANVVMVDTSLDAEGFESYESDEGLVGVDLTRLTDVIGMGNAGQLASLELDEQTRKLQVEIEGLDYTLTLIDPDSIRQEPDITDLDLPVRVVLEGRHLLQAQKATGLVADHLTVGYDADADELVFEASGDTDDVRITVGQDDLIECEADEDAGSFFSNDYLSDICKPINADDEIELVVGSDFPMYLKREFADGYGRCEYTVAPRLKDA